MVSREAFEPTPFHWETQARVEALGRLIPGDAFTADVRRSLYRFALIRNSWGTTNIDAGPIDLARVTEIYEAYHRGASAGRILPTEREVVNYFRLIEDLPTQPFPVSVEDIRLLHQDYFRDVPLQNDARAGRWKSADNAVATPWRVLRTTPKEEVEKALEELLSWYNGAERIPLLARVAVFFHEFQRIHPFGDGNGRVGRVAALFLLSSGGLESIPYCPIDDAINEDRHEYHYALARADEGDLAFWVSYFGAQILTGHQRAHVLAQKLQRIPPKVPEPSRRLLEWAYVHKVGSFKLADARDFYLGESPRTIIRRVQELVELGFLAHEGKGRGARYLVRSLHDIKNATGASGGSA